MYYSIGQLSKKTGVTIRTLDYYHEINLLSPSSKTEGGHRLYTEDDVFRLQQVLAMKYMGFSLTRIKDNLAEGGEVTWQQSLEHQLEMVKEQKIHLEKLEKALKGVLDSIQFEEKFNWHIVFEIIYLFQHNPDIYHKMYEKELNEEEQKNMKELINNRKQEDLQEWKEIIHEVRGLVYEDPASKRAQQLAEQWIHLVHDMFGENHNLQEKMWNIIKNQSNNIAFYPMDNDVIHFIERATNIMYKHQASADKE